MMDFYMLAPIHGFLPESPIHDRIEEEGMSLISNPDVISQHFNIKELIAVFGRLLIANLLSRPFYATHNHFESFEEGIDTTNYIQSTFESMMLSYWFVKDNCGTVNQLYVIPNGGPMMYKTREITNSKADGTLNKTIFSHEEILEAHSYLVLFERFNVTYDGYKVENFEESEAGRHSASLLPDQFNSMPRVGRAILFLQQARSSSFLPMKISFYIQVFECLFSANDSTDISHKIAERIAWYIGSESDLRVDIFNFVKEVYNIRSKFVHGQTLENNHLVQNYLPAKSVELDNLVRKVLRQIMKEDFLIFNGSVSSLKKWLNRLTFGPRKTD